MKTQKESKLKTKDYAAIAAKASRAPGSSVLHYRTSKRKLPYQKRSSKALFHFELFLDRRSSKTRDLSRQLFVYDHQKVCEVSVGFKNGLH